MDTPLVSIVIPCYNSRQYIGEAVESSLAQTYAPCEVIVVDDGSTDGSAEWLRAQYGERIRLIEQPNRGAAGARNTGIREARGEFIQFCDSDDRLLPHKVQAGWETFQQKPETILVYTDYRIVWPDGTTEAPFPDLDLPSGDVFCSLLYGYGNFVGTSTVMARRQAVLDAGGFDEAKSLRVTQDWDLWLRMAASGPFVAIHEAQMLYRKRPGSLASDAIAMAEGRLSVIQRARHLPRRHDCLDDHAYDRYEASRHHKLAIAYWQGGRRADARRALNAAIRLAPDETVARRLYVWMSYLLPARPALRLVQLGSRARALIRSI